MNWKIASLMLLALINVIGIALPYPILSPLFLNGELPPIGSLSPLMTVMLVVALYPLGQFFGSPFFGALSDRIGPRLVIQISMGLTAIGYLSSAYAISLNNMLIFCITRFITGFFEGNFGVLRAAVTRISTDRETKIRYLGYFHAAATTGWVVGPVLGSFLSDNSLHSLFDPAFPFIFGCFMSLSGIAMATVLANASTSTTTSTPLLTSLGAVWKLPLVPLLLLLSFLITLAIDGFYEFYPTLIAASHNGTSRVIAGHTLFLTIGMVTSQVYLVPKLKWTWKTFYIPAVTIALGMLGIALASTPATVAAAFTFSGLGIGILTTLVPAFISENTPRNQQGAIMGTLSSLRSFGDALVCIGFGVLGELNIYLPFLIIGVTIVASADLFGRMILKIDRSKGSISAAP